MIGTILKKVEHNVTVVFFILHIVQYTIIVDHEGLDVVKHFFLLLNKSFYTFLLDLVSLFISFGNSWVADATREMERPEF